LTSATASAAPAVDSASSASAGCRLRLCVLKLHETTQRIPRKVFAVSWKVDKCKALLSGEEPSTEVLKRCIRKGTIANAFVPILCGRVYTRPLLSMT